MVNVLISTYNGLNYIEEQLDSIFEQSYQEFRVYIRDDGSTDDTVATIERYILSHSLQDRVFLKVGTNEGFCKSFFELLNWANLGDYWAFCDQDDVWYPDKLEFAVEWMQKQDETLPLLYHSGFELGNSDLSIKKKYEPKEFNYRFYNSITSNLFFGFSVTINRALYEKLILANPDSIKYHDWFAAMITAAFGKYHLSKKVESIHRQHEKNSSPLFFFKKIPHGIRLLQGDTFYTKNAKEFMRLFGEQLDVEEHKILSWFTCDKYSVRVACKKAFYLKRWNPQLPVELILRALMLIGKI